MLVTLFWHNSFPIAEVINSELPLLLSSCAPSPAAAAASTAGTRAGGSSTQQAARCGLILVKDAEREQTPCEDTEVSTVHSLAAGVSRGACPLELWVDLTHAFVMLWRFAVFCLASLQCAAALHSCGMCVRAMFPQHLLCLAPQVPLAGVYAAGAIGPNVPNNYCSTRGLAGAAAASAVEQRWQARYEADRSDLLGRALVIGLLAG